MSPAISQELGPSPDSSLPSPSRFQGGPRLLPLEADTGDGELPVLAALRDLAPVGDPPPWLDKGHCRPHATTLGQGHGEHRSSVGWQRGNNLCFLDFLLPSPFYFWKR